MQQQGYPILLHEWQWNSLFWIQHYSSHLTRRWPLCVLGSDPPMTSAARDKKKFGFGLTHVCVYISESAKKNQCLLENHLGVWDQTLQPKTRGQGVPPSRVCQSQSTAAQTSHQHNSEQRGQVQKDDLHRLWLDMRADMFKHNYQIIFVAWHTFSWSHPSESRLK